MNLATRVFALLLCNQLPGTSDELQTEQDARLSFMRQSAASFVLRRDETQEVALHFQSDAAFRLGRQYTDLKEGAIFFWANDVRRPEVALQIFRYQNKSANLDLWIHSFSSLSTGPLIGRRDGRVVWHPLDPGIEFKPVPGASPPAESASARSRQLRALAQEFRASDNFRKQGWLNLRLLPTPIARYGKPGTTVFDGAVFTFVEGTDPEVFLFIEARSATRPAEWLYACAPMTVFAVTASHQGKPVWELPDRKPAKNPAKTFFDFVVPAVQP